MELEANSHIDDSVELDKDIPPIDDQSSMIMHSISFWLGVVDSLTGIVLLDRFVDSLPGIVLLDRIAL